MRGQMELGRADLNTPSWAKVAMLGALFKTAEDCMPDFEANGLAAPGADGAGWLPAPHTGQIAGDYARLSARLGTGWLPAPLRAIPTGAALVELGMKCGVEARQRGCDVNTFGTRDPDAEYLHVSCMPTSTREYTIQLFDRIQPRSLYSYPSYSHGALKTLPNTAFPP